MYNSIDVSMYACIIYLCMHVHMCGDKNSCIYVGVVDMGDLGTLVS